MSQFAKSSSRRHSNKERRITVRLGGKQNRSPQRPRPSATNFGAFIKAPVDREGFAMVKSRKPRRHRAQSPLVPKKRMTNSANSFAALDRDDSPSPTHNLALPKVVKSKAPIGAWGAKSAKVLADAPMKSRVSFANDSDNLIKPTAVETREYEKGSATTEFVEYPKDDEYLKLKRSKSAWRPKSVDKIKEDAEKAMAILNAQPKTPTYIGSWADACDSDSEDEEDEIVLSVDSLGRPTTDNSAW